MGSGVAAVDKIVRAPMKTKRLSRAAGQRVLALSAQVLGETDRDDDKDDDAPSDSTKSEDDDASGTATGGSGFSPSQQQAESSTRANVSGSSSGSPTGVSQSRSSASGASTGGTTGGADLSQSPRPQSCSKGCFVRQRRLRRLFASVPGACDGPECSPGMNAMPHAAAATTQYGPSGSGSGAAGGTSAGVAGIVLPTTTGGKAGKDKAPKKAGEIACKRLHRTVLDRCGQDRFNYQMNQAGFDPEGAINTIARAPHRDFSLDGDCQRIFNAWFMHCLFNDEK